MRKKDKSQPLYNGLFPILTMDLKTGLRQAGLTLCTVVALSLPPKISYASLNCFSLNCALLEYTASKKESLREVIKQLYGKTIILDPQGHPTGSYPTHLKDMEQYQASIPWLNGMNLSDEVQLGQKLVLPYGGRIVCGHLDLIKREL